MPPVAKRPPVRALYRAPDGYEDTPFTWAFDGTNLIAGVNALNQYVYIQRGLGDFIMRRCVGLATVISPATGSFQLRDSQKRSLGDPMFIGQVNDDLMFPNEVLYPETSLIGFDLYSVLPDPPPVVLAPPVQIDNSAQQSGFANRATATIVTNNASVTPADVDCGPWKAPNGALYCLLTTLVGPTYTMNVFKSLNGGLTWTQQDVANSPVINGSGGFFNSQFNATTGLLTIAYGTGSLAPNTISWASFNTATDKFAAAIYPNVTDVNSGPDFVVRADGSVVFLYQQVAGGVGVRVNTAGVWSAFTNVTPATAGHTYIPAGVYLDSAQTTHCIHIDYPPAAAARRFNDVPWSSTNVLGAVALIFTEDTFNGAVLQRGAILGTSLLLPASQQNAGATQSKIQVFAGTPLAAPVYSATTLETIVGSPAINNSRLQVYGGTAYLSWNDIPSAATLQMRYATNGGSGWSVPATFYDAVLNPPNAVPAASQTILDVSILSGSLFGLATMKSLAGGSPAFFLIGGAGPKVITAQVAFQGVRRLKRTNPPPDDQCDYDEPSFTYVLTGTIADVGPAKTPSAILVQTINDYDFDLYQVVISYQAASPLPAIVSSLQIFDENRVRISNIPLLDIFYNGAPGSRYRNGAMVPPLRYRQSTTLRIEVFSLTSVVPVTVTVHLVGRQRYPKGALRNTA
jgi:hypothetical protein